MGLFGKFQFLSKRGQDFPNIRLIEMMAQSPGNDACADSVLSCEINNEIFRDKRLD